MILGLLSWILFLFLFLLLSLEVFHHSPIGVYSLKRLLLSSTGVGNSYTSATFLSYPQKQEFCLTLRILLLEKLIGNGRDYFGLVIWD